MPRKKYAQELPLKALLAQEVTNSDTIQETYDRYNTWLRRDPEAVARMLGGTLRNEFFTADAAAADQPEPSRDILHSALAVLDATEGGHKIGIGPGDGDKVWGAVYDDPYHYQAGTAYEAHRRALKLAEDDLENARQFAEQLRSTDGHQPALTEVQRLEQAAEQQAAHTALSLRRRGLATLRVIALEQLDTPTRQSVEHDLAQEVATDALLIAD